MGMCFCAQGTHGGNRAEKSPGAASGMKPGRGEAITNRLPVIGLSGRRMGM